MSDTQPVIPTGKSGSGPKLIDPAKTAAHVLGYAAVEGMKALIKGAGATVEFGTAIIIDNQGKGIKTKKP